MSEKILINLKNVSVIRDDRYILKNINWTIYENESWAIIGRNGSGKSFLLNLLSTNIYPSYGEVSIFGCKMGKTNVWDLRSKIGFVSDKFQNQYYKNIIVDEVILSGFFSSIGLYEKPTKEQIEKTNEVIEKLGISHLKNRDFGKLSQGEQKKVLIGRSLIFNPSLLIFDEPTNGLDIASREDYLETVNNLIKDGHNVIIVTHFIEEILSCINKILLLKNGEIYKYGDKKEILTEKNINDILEIDIKIIEKNGRFWGQYF